MKDMKCSEPGCKGKILKDVVVNLMCGCDPVPTFFPTNPCGVCGLLHGKDGSVVLNRVGNKTFLKNNKVLVRDEKGEEIDITEKTS